MDSLLTVIAVVIAIPFILFVSFFIGALIRGAVFKEENMGKNIGQIVLTIIIGIAVICVLGTVFEDCGGGDENMEVWKRGYRE